jgi:hypothetical protein
VWYGLLLLCAVMSGTAVAAKEPETHSLLKGPVQASALGGTRIYVIQSNVLMKCEFGEKAWEIVSPLPLRKPEETIQSLRASLRNPFALFLLTDRYLYISRDAGASWSSRMLVLEKRTYYDIAIYPGDENKILLGTSDGAWLSTDNGQTFNRFFLRVQQEENDVITVAYDERKDCVYLSTRGGMFISTDDGNTFYKVMDLPGPYITHIAVAPNHRGASLFVADGRAFYSDSRLKSYHLLSSIYNFNSCQQVAIAENGRDIIWSYPGGVLWGKDWISAVPQPPEPVRRETPVLETTEEPVTVVTKDAETAEQERILESERRRLMEEKYNKVMERIRLEPSAREVVDASIEYAKLNPEVIEQWIKDLKKSSWMPEVRVLGDADFGGGKEYGTEGMGTLGRPVRYRTDKSKGDSAFGTEAELKWHLGRIFFNPLQLDIDDRRSRQTDLREDVANTATIYYFQRRNLLFRKLFNPPDNLTELSRLEFQIEELSTKLDTLSGGYFSEELKKRLSE